MPKLLPAFYQSSKGQALIILLLVMVVALTVGLSVASRTITDVRISTQTEQSTKAFAAAEAGIEEALRRDLAVFTGLENIPVGEAEYSVTVTPAGAGKAFTPDRPVAKDDVVQVALAGTTAISLNIYWIDSADTAQTTTPASIEISEVYLEGTDYKIFKSAYNSDCGHPNGFTCNSPGSFDLGDKTYTNKVTISLNPNPQILRIRPFYNRASVAVEVEAPAVATLPVQSYFIESTGEVGGIQRKIQVSRSKEALPPIFDYVLFSGGDLSK